MDIEFPPVYICSKTSQQGRMVFTLHLNRNARSTDVKNCQI